MDEKERKSLFQRYAKKRVTVIDKDKSERKQIKNALRENGVQNIVEYDNYDDAWGRLQLSTTSVLVFSATDQDGLDFITSVVESARFRKTPLVIFTNKLREYPKLFSNEDMVVFWEELPMNGFKVEQAIVKVFQKGVVEKNLLGRDSISLEHYSKALEALSAEKYEEAKELLRMALKEIPDFFEAYVKMAEALIALGEIDAAMRVLAKAESLRPDHPKVLSLKARIAADTLDKEKAIKVFDAAVAKRPRDLMFIIDIGNLALSKGWVDDAVRYYETAQNVDPQLIHVYNRLGMAHSRGGRYDKALSMYSRALEIDEDDAGVHFNIGMTYRRKGENEKAVEYFSKAKKLDPGLMKPREWAELIGEEPAG